MINIDEERRAKDTIKIIESKVNENKKLMEEKTKSINDTFNSFFNSKDGSGLDLTGTQMMNSINYDRSINNIADRQLNRYLMMLKKPYFGRIDFENEWGEQPYYFGIESLIYDNEVIVNDWISPIANLYYEGVFGKASY